MPARSALRLAYARYIDYAFTWIVIKRHSSSGAADNSGRYEFITTSWAWAWVPDRNMGYGGQLIHITVTLSGSEEYRNGPITAAVLLPWCPSSTDEDTLWLVSACCVCAAARITWPRPNHWLKLLGIVSIDSDRGMRPWARYVVTWRLISLSLSLSLSLYLYEGELLVLDERVHR